MTENPHRLQNEEGEDYNFWDNLKDRLREVGCSQEQINQVDGYQRFAEWEEFDKVWEGGVEDYRKSVVEHVIGPAVNHQRQKNEDWSYLNMRYGRGRDEGKK